TVSFFGVGLDRVESALSGSPILNGPFETRTNGITSHAFAGTSITRIVVDPTNHNNIFVGNTFGRGGISGSIICCGGFTPPSAFIGLYFSANALGATPTFAEVETLPGGGLAGVSDIVMEPGNPNAVVLGLQDFGGTGTDGI